MLLLAAALLIMVVGLSPFGWSFWICLCLLALIKYVLRSSADGRTPYGD